MKMVSMILLMCLYLPQFCGATGNVINENHTNHAAVHSNAQTMYNAKFQFSSELPSDFPVELPVGIPEHEDLVPIEEISEDGDSESAHLKLTESVICWIMQPTSGFTGFLLANFTNWVSDTHSPPPDLVVLFAIQ